MKIRQLLALGLVSLLWLSCAAAADARQEALRQPKPNRDGQPKGEHQVPLQVNPSKASQATLQDEPRVPELVIAGHVIVRLRSYAGGLTPEERAYDLRRRLGVIFTLPDLRAEDVEVW